jgi:hypothetical protein
MADRMNRRNRLPSWRAAAIFCCLAVWAGRVVAAPSEAECQARVNATPARLGECIQQHALWRVLSTFQAIADANPDRRGHPNRNTGTAGYKASVDYVAGLMRKAGYSVKIQSYDWEHRELSGQPAFGMGGQDLVLGRDWWVAAISGSRVVSAPVVAIGVGRGCAAGDFASFTKGAIALLAPGMCDADLQVANAQDAGAGAVILAPDDAGQGSPDKMRVRDQAGLAAPAGIPVIGVTAALGASLRRQAGMGMAHLAVQTRQVSATDYNLIADSPFGDAGHMVVVDGHLDAIYGAGILDNASGSTTMLDIALNLANTPTRNRLRYIWFGGEELGLLGSHYYTRHLPPDELSRIAFDLDVDVTATPNFDVLIADPGHASDRLRFPPDVVPQSQIGNTAFTDVFRKAGIASRLARFGNDGTDSNAFSLVGVPNTGILTQQDCCKKPWEVRIWGGYTGDYEGVVPGVNGQCVDTPGRWCDDLSNNDPFVLEFVSRAVAEVTLRLANTNFTKTGP